MPRNQNQNRPAPAKPTKDELAIMKRDVVDVVSGRIERYIADDQLHLPPGYSVQNALKSAWLALQAATDKKGNSVLKVCMRDSIANSLLSMVVQGLNPDKKQCYFIPYGAALTCQRSYFGAIAVARRMSGVRDVFAEVVYEGDEFQYSISRGVKTVTKHVQSLANVHPDKIVAAYAVITFSDDAPEYTEVMTWEQIQKAWTKSKAGPSRADSPHSEFPDQMAMRTVINRATKRYVNSSSDDHLLLHHFNGQDGDLAEVEMDDEIGELDDRTIDVTVVTPEEDVEPEEPEEPEEAQEAEAPTNPPKAPENGGGSKAAAKAEGLEF